MEIADDMTLSARTIRGAHAFFDGEKRGWRNQLAFVGPAVVASIAYVDPGNIATNIQAGAKYGYTLLWVVLFANLVAMLFQGLSAKIGIVTGRNLAELCREHFPRPLVLGMWIAAELAAMATDLAEFLGAAIGLSLCLNLPLLIGMLVTAVLVYAILCLQSRGFRQIEIVIGALIALIGGSYLAELLLSPVNWGAVAFHSVVPQIENSDALMIAIGMIGATVMPHAIFLHSGLTQQRIPTRNAAEKRRLIRLSHGEVIFALAAAGVINMAMVITAAAAFHAGHSDVAEIETAYRALTPVLGKAAGVLFLVSLLASGLSSSVVGTMAGQMIMQGFVGFRLPLWLRRAITMAPAFAVVAYGVNSTEALVYSQVALSLLLPVPVIAMLILARRTAIMGAFRTGLKTQILIGACGALIIVLNIALIAQSCFSVNIADWLA
jgi:manganese transport protein